jgi:hypothetical protein
MSTRRFQLLTALCGILGVVILITSFLINLGPPSGATIAQIMVWGKQNANSVLLGAWLQGIGSLLNVVFVFALVRMANATTWLSGWITKLAGTITLMVSLTEIIFYLSAVYGGLNNDSTTVSTSLILIKAVQHLYFIAPPILLPLGVVVLGSRILPRAFGYLALGIGVVFMLLGLVFLFVNILNILDFVPGLFALWILAAAITLIVNARKTSDTRSLQEHTPDVHASPSPSPITQ